MAPTRLLSARAVLFRAEIFSRAAITGLVRACVSEASHPPRTACRFVLRVVVCAALGCAATTPLPAADAPPTARQTYHLAAGDAATTLKTFAADCGEQIVYLVDNVRGETTNAVEGEFAPREA